LAENTVDLFAEAVCIWSCIWLVVFPHKVLALQLSCSKDVHFKESFLLGSLRFRLWKVVSVVWLLVASCYCGGNKYVHVSQQ